MNPLPDRSNYSPPCHTHYLTPINTSLVSLGQTLYQAGSCKTNMLQRFTAESSRELSALRKLNNKQRQVSMFLILLFKLLTQFPFVSFPCISPFSILSLPPLPHAIPSFSSDQFCLPKIKTSNFITFCFINGTFFLHSVSHHDIFLIMHSISLACKNQILMLELQLVIPWGLEETMATSQSQI